MALYDALEGLPQKGDFEVAAQRHSRKKREANVTTRRDTFCREEAALIFTTLKTGETAFLRNYTRRNFEHDCEISLLPKQQFATIEKPNGLHITRTEITDAG